MWAPEDFQRMYPNKLGSLGRTVQFQVSGDEPDFERHPLAGGLRCWEVVVSPGEQLFIPGYTIHQVTSIDACISVNVFFGDEGESAFLEKIMSSPRQAAFEFWLNNIIETNRQHASFKNALPYLPQSLDKLLRSTFREQATEVQLEQLCKVVSAHCGHEFDSVVPAEDAHTRKNVPKIQIRGLKQRGHRLPDSRRPGGSAFTLHYHPGSDPELRLMSAPRPQPQPEPAPPYSAVIHVYNAWLASDVERVLCPYAAVIHKAWLASWLVLNMFCLYALYTLCVDQDDQWVVWLWLVLNMGVWLQAAIH